MARRVRAIHRADGAVGRTKIQSGRTVDPPDEPGDDGGESETKTKPASLGAPVFFWHRRTRKNRTFARTPGGRNATIMEAARGARRAAQCERLTTVYSPAATRSATRAIYSELAASP